MPEYNSLMKLTSTRLDVNIELKITHTDTHENGIGKVKGVQVVNVTPREKGGPLPQTIKTADILLVLRELRAQNDMAMFDKQIEQERTQISADDVSAQITAFRGQIVQSDHDRQTIAYELATAHNALAAFSLTHDEDAITDAQVTLDQVQARAEQIAAKAKSSYDVAYQNLHRDKAGIEQRLGRQAAALNEFMLRRGMLSKVALLLANQTDTSDLWMRSPKVTEGALL